MKNKKELAIVLSKLKTFGNPKAKFEQYPTPPELAAEIIWMAYMKGDIAGKEVADFGCGPGILGIGAALLDADNVHFVDKDEEVLKIAEENANEFIKTDCTAVFDLSEIENFEEKVDTVIMNPPFGVQEEHADRIFLLKAMEKAGVIYSIHKIESKNFIEKIAEDNGFKSELVITKNMDLKKTQKFHTKDKYQVEIGVWRLNRKP